jgi:hypothetical protein
LTKFSLLAFVIPSPFKFYRPESQGRTVAEEDLTTNATAIHYAKAKEDATLETFPLQYKETYHEDVR